jgi:hypothetical protein
MLKIFFLFFLLSANLALADELKIVTAESFVAENPSPERKAIVDFIIHQFDGKSVSQKELGKLWNNKKIRESQHLMRFQIVNQKLYTDTFDISHFYFVWLFEYFQQYIKNYKVKDIDFIVQAVDKMPADNENSNQDILSTLTFLMSKTIGEKKEKNKLLMPDAYMLRKNKWNNLTKEVIAAQTPWNIKIDKVFWRGSSTGSNDKYLYNISNFDKLTRLKLTILSKLYPDLIDAVINKYFEFSDNKDGDNLKKILNLLFDKKMDKISEVDHLRYKYLIAVDGNTCPWMRVPWIMLSNSVLVKQETKNMEWFYPALKPYFHYVPVKEDLTDIFQQIEWMKSHDKELQKISANAQNFVKNNLMPKDIDAHMTIILNEYAKIQKDDKIIATLTPADDVISLKSVTLMLLKRVKKYFVGICNSWF